MRSTIFLLALHSIPWLYADVAWSSPSRYDGNKQHCDALHHLNNRFNRADLIIISVESLIALADHRLCRKSDSLQAQASPYYRPDPSEILSIPSVVDQAVADITETASTVMLVKQRTLFTCSSGYEQCKNHDAGGAGSTDATLMCGLDYVLCMTKDTLRPGGSN